MEPDETEAALLANDAVQERIQRAHQGEGLVRRTDGRWDNPER